MNDQTTPAATWRVQGEPDPHGTHYNCERHELTLGKYTDDELANGAFLNYDRPLDVHAVMSQKPGYHSPIAWMTAVKDRIRWLSRKLSAADEEIAAREADSAIKAENLETLREQNGKLREALERLVSDAGPVLARGAITGPQWLPFGVSLFKARAALGESK